MGTRLSEMARERQLDQLIYIPGSWACTKCEFGQVITNLYVNSGTVGPNTDEVPICPNDGTLMRRCTWKERVMSDDIFITEKLNEIDALKVRVKELEHTILQAKREGLEEAAMIADDEMVDADDTKDESDYAYNSACRDVGKAIRQRAQEGGG